MRRRVLSLLAMAVAVAFCWLRSYEVLPTQASWNGVVPDGGYVGEVFTANFDSITEVQVFVGCLGANPSVPFRVEVRDYATNDRVAYKYDVVADEEHSWVKFQMTPDGAGKFTRGREYLLKVTRFGEAIHWYKSALNNYHYGHMVLGGTGLQPPASGDDLCARIYGKARVGMEFAVVSNLVCDQGLADSAHWRRCIQRMHEVGVQYDKIGYAFWGYVQPDSGQWDWGWFDSLVSWYAQESVRTIMSIRGVPDWVTCAEHDTGRYQPKGWIKYCSAVPVNAFEAVRDPSNQDSINPANYLAKYVFDLVRRYGPKGYAYNGTRCGTFWDAHGNLRYQPMLMFEDFPEMSLDAVRRDYGYRGYWRLDTIWPAAIERLTDSVYRSMIPAGNTHEQRRMSFLSLAARVIIVIDSAVKMACKTPDSDTLRPRTIAYVTDDNAYDDDEWLEGLKQNHADEFFDLGSCWSYQAMFHPEYNEGQLSWLRGLLRDAGYAPRGFVFTEYGTAGPPAPLTQNDRAYHLFEAYSAIQAANITPGYPVEAAAWFTFTAQYMGHGPGSRNSPDRDSNWAIVDSAANNWESWQPAYAYQQLSDLCQGASFEGRIPPYNHPVDTIWGVSVRQYRDSQGKRFWLAWQPRGADWGRWGPSTLRVPARADTESGCGMDTGGSFNAWAGPAESSGWFAKEFDTTPVIVFEGQNLSRPELEVDSFWVKPYPPVSYCFDTFFVRIKNRDAERSTPENCTTWVLLTWNGNVLDSMYRTDTIGHGQSCTLTLHRNVPGWMRDSGLLAASVNPEMRYVEREGTDDNTAFLRLFVPYELIGVIDAITPPGGQSDPPLLPLRLTSNSWGTDTMGQESADSARIVLSYWGQRDSVVQATDTTAWFPFCSDTVLEFPRGCGKYSLQAQFRDSGAHDSPFYGDSTDSIVVFDSVPPAGSIVIEDGGRFASSSSRTLRLTACDSSSGICDMRFMNRPRVNLVRNGGFVAAEGLWSFTNGTYDTSLSMSRLSVGPSQAGVRQFVAPESISAYSGDSCVLEASILAHVHDGEATGEVSFWYFSTNENPEITDTLWELADSASYSGDLLSLTGRSNLSTRFLLATPTPESGWVWQGGMARVRAQGVDGGTGTVWADNVSLNAFQPESAYAWWGPYDTLAEWDIGSTAGQHIVRAIYLDSAGTENVLPYADTVILDPTPPVVDISLPDLGQLVSGLVQVTGWAYDPIEVEGDTWFEERTLSYRHVDSTNWLPVSPDSVSYEPAYPDSMASQGPAVHLGYWNTLEFEDGIYYLLLTASDSAGNTSSCTTWVMVDQGFGGGDMCGGPEGGGSGLGEGSVYVGSATGTVLHLSDDLDSLDAFSVDDSGSQANITAIVEVGEDSILILDAHNRRVHKLHRSGQHRRRLVSGLSQPVDLKQDTNGNFWLADRGWNRIGKFRSNGTLVFVRGGLGADTLHFNAPEGIAIKGGLVYVADGGNNRIAVWDTSGHFKATITGDFENPTAVWVMESGAIYLTDGTDGKLKGITPLGGNIVTIGTTDSSKLRGLVPSENRHSLFSLASAPNKVYKLRIQSDESQPGGAQSGGKVNLPKTLCLNQPFPNPARTRLNIAYALPRQTRVELKLYDVAGKLVTTLANGEQKPGYYNLTWNRQDTKGRSCACGVYFCTLVAENQRFSRKVILTE